MNFNIQKEDIIKTMILLSSNDINFSTGIFNSNCDFEFTSLSSLLRDSILENEISVEECSLILENRYNVSEIFGDIIEIQQDLIDRWISELDDFEEFHPHYKVIVEKIKEEEKNMEILKSFYSKV